jgi:hypothetical protein
MRTYYLGLPKEKDLDDQIEESVFISKALRALPQKSLWYAEIS